MQASELFEGQSNFAIFLRTGRRFRHQGGADVEVKFNPWHDPEDGRFTFKGQGNYFGGETFSGHATGPNMGGGGASGSWETSKVKRQRDGEKQRALETLRKIESIKPRPPSLRSGVPSAAVIAKPRRTVTSNNYSFDFEDANAIRPRRTRSAEGSLQAERGKRVQRLQDNAGGDDKRGDNHGGHYIGIRFKGPHIDLNHFAQNGNFNTGTYRVLEDEWARDLRAGRQVYVRIVPRYEGESQRPYTLDVFWTVDGVRKSQKFKNERGGR